MDNSLMNGTSKSRDNILATEDSIVGLTSEGGENTMTLGLIFHLGKIESSSSKISRILLKQSFCL